MHTENLKAFSQQVKKIPNHRWKYKIGKSLFGVFLIVVSGLIAFKLEYPWYVALPVFAAGCHIFSEDLTKSVVKFIVSAIKDLYAAIKKDT